MHATAYMYSIPITSTTSHMDIACADQRTRSPSNDIHVIQQLVSVWSGEYGHLNTSEQCLMWTFRIKHEQFHIFISYILKNFICEFPQIPRKIGAA